MERIVADGEKDELKNIDDKIWFLCQAPKKRHNMYTVGRMSEQKARRSVVDGLLDQDTIHQEALTLSCENQDSSLDENNDDLLDRQL